MRVTSAAAVACAGVLVVLFGVVGYLVGAAGAASESEAAGTQRATRLTAQRSARQSAYSSSFNRAQVKGIEKGAQDGRQAGGARGEDAGGAAVEDRLAAIQRREAEQAATATAATSPTAGLEYTDELPSGLPGYLLPPEERSLACVGYDAATGQCVGD